MLVQRVGVLNDMSFGKKGGGKVVKKGADKMLEQYAQRKKEGLVVSGRTGKKSTWRDVLLAAY